MAGFDWGKFGKTMRQKFGKKKKLTADAVKKIRQKGNNAWRQYVQGK